jgi:signal transduction histidine kinase
MAEVATGVLHNVGNVLNSLGVASSTAQMRLKAWQIHRVGQIAAMLEENRDTLAQFLTTDVRGKRVPEYLVSLAARLETDTDATRRDFDAIGGHVQYLRQIIQAQQSFARMGGAHDEVDVSELLETALTLKAQDLKGVDVTRDIGDLPIVRTDRYKLLQIIVNFVANACDAVTENSSTPPRIAVRARTVLDRLEIAVEDSGVGIAPEVLARVWEFGFTTKTHGHGFGLHSAAVAAQQLGGAISAESAGIGQGARFSVTIPINSAGHADRVAAA